MLHRLIVLVIGTLTFCGTSLDLANAYWPDPTKPTKGSVSRLRKVILSFSAYTNGQRLLSTSQGHGSISVIPGIRFLSMAWIVIGHTGYLLIMRYANNVASAVDIVAKSRASDFISSMHFGVDSFFAISGFLVAYLNLKQVQDKGWHFNWRHFFLHRYFRLTPPFLIVVFLVQGLQRFMVSGAMAPTSQPSDKVACDKHWWLLPLYINNLLDLDLEERCWSHAWSLAADMQFYLLSPLMLIPFYYHKYAGISSCLFFIVGQWILTGVLSYRVGGGIGMLRSSREWYKNCYYPFYARIAPFAIGVLSGYMVSSNNDRVLMSKNAVITGWIVATTAMLAVIFGFHGDLSGESPSSLLVASIYNAVSRSIWGASICWIIVACTSGYGGAVNTFLSWPPFIVLGRLTYIGYLVQFFISTVIFENLEQPIYYNKSSLATFAAAGLFFTCAISALLVICLEIPTFNLDKVFSDKI